MVWADSSFFKNIHNIYRPIVSLNILESAKSEINNKDIIYKCSPWEKLCFMLRENTRTVDYVLLSVCLGNSSVKLNDVNSVQLEVIC